MGQSAYNVAVEREMSAAAEVLKAAKADTGPVRFPELEGPYMGQRPPGEEPERFATGIVSSIWSLHCSIVFSPAGDTAFWPPMFTYPGEIYSRGTIVMSSNRHGRWTPPTPAPFVGDARGDAAFFAPDGSRVYFISRRTLPGEPESRRERIWYVDREEEGWAPAQLVDPIVNDYPQHWQFSVDAEHTIYFSTDLPEGYGGGDIYSSTFSDGRWQIPVNLGAQINSQEGEGTPFIAADGSYLIFGRGGDLFISYRKKDGGWTQPQDVGPPINSESRELCPIVSPDGKYLFFLSTRQGSSDVFWVSATFIDRLKPANDA
jgi:Tol biopolymer transport system component